jgi:YVTN family beta-propeller protein
VSSQTAPSGARSPLYLIVLFAATLGAYWPIRLFGIYAELAKATPRPTRLTPRTAVLLAVLPLVNLVAPAYLAIDLPRAIRRVSARDTEVLSILLLLPVAGGVATAILLGLSLPLVLLVAGYLAWIFNLPAALALERAVPVAGAAGRRETAIALGAAVVVLAVTGVVLASGGDDEQDTPAQPAQAVSEVSDIAVTPEALWVTNTVRGTVLKLDKRTRRPLAPPIRVGLEPLDIAVGAGAVWVANYRSGTVLRIDPASNQLTGPIKTGRGPFGIDVGLGAVWVTNQVERTVTRIDPRTNKVAGPSATVGRGPRGVSAGEGAVWVANGEGKSVSRVLPSGNGEGVRQIRLGRFAHDVAAGGGSVWVTIPEDGVVRRIDPRTARLRGGPITLPGGPSSTEVGLGLVWVAGEAGAVTRLDPESGNLVGAAVDVGGRISDITVGEGAAWVLRADGRVRRIPAPG